MHFQKFSEVSTRAGCGGTINCTLRYNKGRISHILWLDPIDAGSILLTANLVALKRENYEPILTVEGTEWSKLIDYLV